MALVDPVIVVPGIIATYLDDVYPLPPQTIWSVMTKNYERAALHPDDLRYEAIEPALVRPGQLVEMAYRELIEELRYNLADREDWPVPVFPFAYDWRQPLEMSAAKLGSFIEEVIARTKLMRHYDRAGYDEDPRVNLVGHSMGGLVIATWLKAGLGEADWLCIAGVDAETRVRLRIVQRRGKPDFAFDSADRANEWRTGNVPGQRRRTGDGTVPFEAALPHFLPAERVVCVHPDDFGYWEIVDRLAMRLGGFHALLPAMDMLHRLIVRFLKNRDDPRGNTWGVPAPGVDEGAWAPPVRGTLRIRD